MSLLTSLLTALVAATPHTSFHQLPLSNGFGAAVVDAETGALTTLFTHPYAERSPGDVTPDVAFDAYFGVALDGQGGEWLGKRDALEADYEAGTGLVHAVHQVGAVRARTTWFMPRDLDRPAVAMVARLTNTDAVTPHDATVAALLNFHLGEGAPEADELDERIQLVEPATYLEAGQETPHRMVYRAVPTPNQLAATPNNPFAPFQDTGTLPGDPNAGDVNVPVLTDDAVAGLGRGPMTLQPGEERWFAVVAVYGTESEEGGLAAVADGWIAGRSPEQLVADERADWEAFQARDRWVEEVTAGGAEAPSADEQEVWRQALAVLRMAQVREPNTEDASPHGQILASLPPGMWSRTWPRDAAYAIAALARVGYAEEAWDGLEFILRGDAGKYAEQVGTDYLVSVARYYGDGTEESDGDPDAEGPNIEFDDFGLFLWALGEWADEQDDLQALAPFWPDVRERVADVIVSLVEPETGLLRPDSSIWERHWNGNQKHFTYSNVAAVAGLCAASRLATRFGEEEVAAQYAARADAIRDAVLTHLVDPQGGALMGNLEEMAQGQAVDAAVIEAVNWGLLAPDAPATEATFALLDTLRIGPERGFARNDAGGWYDEQEWVFIDLRIAAAWLASGRDFAAEPLLAWIVDQARANLDLLPELYTREEADYAGAVPMAGFGGGAFALARLPDRAVMDAEGCLPWEPDTPPVADEGPEAGPEPGPEPVPERAPEAQPETAPDAGEPDAEAPDAAEPDAGGTTPDPSPPFDTGGDDDGCAGGGGAAPWLLAGLVLLAMGRRRRGGSTPRVAPPRASGTSPRRPPCR